jgi:hypothetical protein
MPQGCHPCHWGRQMLCRWMKRSIMCEHEYGRAITFNYGERASQGANEPIFQAAPPSVPLSTPLCIARWKLLPGPSGPSAQRWNRRDYRRCAMQPESSTNSIACMSLWLCNDTKVSIRRLQKRFAVIGADKRVEFVREIKKKKRKNLHWLSTITLWKSHGTQIFFINWLGTHGRHPK